MENIKNKIAKKNFRIDNRMSTEWQEMGKELTAHFNRNCYWLLWRYPIHKIREKFKSAQKENWDIRYFIGALRQK